MLATRRSLVVLGAAAVVVIVSVTMVLARATREVASTASLLQVTATVWIYEPIVLRNYAPPTLAPTETLVPTVTPTPTATPIPEQIRLYLCCFVAIDETCQGCSGAWQLSPGALWEWESDALSVDIGDTAYEFAIAAKSGSSTVFEVELYLLGVEDLLLASTSFTADSSKPEQYTRVVQGIDPAVRIGQDRLMVRITNIAGTAGTVYFGDPSAAEAGGSYFEFTRAK